jgi:hypothetical protein
MNQQDQEIPIVIFHIGAQEYFKRCVKINSQKNKVYVIGDESNENLFKENANVTHIHKSSLNEDEVKRMESCFVNYSTNQRQHELNCFLRIFYLKQFMLLFQLERAFHADSDCIVLDNVDHIFEELPDVKVAYSVQKHCQERNPYHMVGSVHSSLLNLDFCDVFIQMCFDIYENRTKYHLIEDKVNWHRDNNHPGGICDMTLYYLIDKVNLIEVTDLNDLHRVDDCYSAFDHALYNSYGYLGTSTYKASDGNGKKKLIQRDRFYYFETVNGNFVRALSIHFQGEWAKWILEKLDDVNNVCF